jgi:hypothetical protein
MVERRPSIRRLTRQEFLLLGVGAGAGLALAGCGGGPQNNPALAQRYIIEGVSRSGLKG